MQISPPTYLQIQLILLTKKLFLEVEKYLTSKTFNSITDGFTLKVNSNLI